MKTTLNLDDTLYRRAKIKAIEEGRTVSELIEECLRVVLGGGSSLAAPVKRVPLPLIESVPADFAGDHLTPEKGAGILLSQETSWAIAE